MGLTGAIKIGFLSILLFLFIVLFGLPSWKKFSAGGLTVEHSTVRPEAGNILPGITLCAYNSNSRTQKTAWKKSTSTISNSEDILAIECNVTNGRDMLACIEEKTYSNIGEIVLDVLDGWISDKKYFSWLSLYSGGIRGTCHSLSYHHPIGTNHKDTFMMRLNPNISYDIFLHDPVFFWPTLNPSAIPHSKFSIDGGPVGDGIQLLFMEVINRIQLNTPASPCVPSFLDCIDIFMNENHFENFSTVEEILRIDQVFTNLMFATNDDLVKITGCQKPCEFKEYKLVGGKPDAIKKDHGFGLAFTSNEMSVLTEVRICPSP